MTAEGDHHDDDPAAAPILARLAILGAAAGCDWQPSPLLWVAALITAGPLLRHTTKWRT